MEVEKAVYARLWKLELNEFVLFWRICLEYMDHRWVEWSLLVQGTSTAGAGISSPPSLLPLPWLFFTKKRRNSIYWHFYTQTGLKLASE